ncbi:BrnT family toxin [uncultured Sulfitobacter sp.]|uniref:BrnT family toxin n=1 Tax=uncultured Sulfitobacter sp. TaxID=191468 RepID=UPI00260B4042|nr:BrnT family toxin [uncultured Sulfitobacter sp.]
MQDTPPPPYDWDSEKARQNLEKHGVAFSIVTQFDWAGAIEAEDTRYDYGETRMQALGKIGDRYHVLVYAIRADTIRIISLRKANKRETP